MEGKKQPSFSVISEHLSKVYGWTPDEIRNMASDDIEIYLEIGAIRAKIEENELKKQNGRLKNT